LALFFAFLCLSQNCNPPQQFTRRQANMPLPADITVDAMMMDLTLCLVFFGEPPTQICASAWYNVIRRRVVMYVPSKTVKHAYKVLLQPAWQTWGIAMECPFFIVPAA
jgi:hypothetical protein